jgi:hypothetical protein
MASTRNKNTPSDYCLQQRAYAQGRQETIYKHSAYGEAYTTKWAGNGLNPGQLPWNTMSKNAPDIESFLFGINSTNLVNPQPNLTPELNQLSTANVFEKEPTYIPQPLVIEKKQRPFPTPK